MENLKFGRLLVVKKSEIKKHNRVSYLCKCECGNTIVATGNTLKSGNTKSCGCIRKEKPNHKTHGLTKHILYSVYNNMLLRCYNPRNPKYDRYGGRGISVFSVWVNSFKCFFDFCINNGWVDGLELDRIDNNGDYVPNNIRFVTRKENCRNQERTIYVCFEGEKISLKEWAEINNVSYSKVYQRIKILNWSIDKAIII